MTAMKSWLPLDQLNLDADTKKQVSDMIQTLLDQAQKEIRAQELKIQALTLELAHLRRIRFDRRNESLTLFPSQSQPDLFEETMQTDTAAVTAEIEQLDSSAKQGANKPPRIRAGRQPLPDHLPRIEHRHEPPSANAGNVAVIWSKSAKTSLNSWMLSRQDFLCTATFVRNMRAKSVKPSPQSLFHPR
jgi:hypothetical protein